ncbi:MAG: vitamin K epoxide reductase family protein [Acidobacteriota bacterium]|nr:vitamin K epoxide reductase family protein [Acidobacteriota bacterium]
MPVADATARKIELGISLASAAAMLYVGAYQVRVISHLQCPIFHHGCDAVADAPFARPFGIPDGFIAAALYVPLIALSLTERRGRWQRIVFRTAAILAAVANVLGVRDMYRLGAYCFYCLLTTALALPLIWLAFRRIPAPERRGRNLVPKPLAE